MVRQRESDFFVCARVCQAILLSSQQDAHVRAARNSDRTPRSHTYVASRKGARSASGMQSCWLDKLSSHKGKGIQYIILFDCVILPRK